jgi:cytochrome bd-type quinol oxidase subunit 1
MYPTFDVPWIGGPWVIGLMAIVHVFISHFGVGGGLYLPLMEWYARRRGDLEMLGYLRHLSKFFLIVTGVYGAATGVGIWWAIGLVNPVATSWLLHTFVMAWSVEWVVFLVEMSAITVYHYGWARLSPKNHVRVGWLLAAASFATLVVINGILTFMLTPGESWLRTRTLWSAFANPTYLPSLALRTLVALSLVALWGLLPATRIKSPGVRRRVMRSTALWIVPAYVLMPLFALWYLTAVPASAVEVLRGGMRGMATGNLSVATRVLMVVVMASFTIGLCVYFGPWKNPLGFGRGQAICMMVLGLVATGSTEWVREVLRKPFAVKNVMYSSGVRPEQVKAWQATGFFEHAPWAREFAKARGDTQLARGEALFRGQCMSCHTRRGYRGLDQLVGARDADAMTSFIRMISSTDPKQNVYLAFMPPFVGTQNEAGDLAAYLVTLRK